MLAAMVAEVDRGGLRDAKASVAELLERWFEHAREDFSLSTERETRAILDRSILPALGSVPLNKLTVADIDRFYRRLLKSGGKGGRPLAPANCSPGARRPAPSPRSGREVGLARPESGRRRQPAPRRED